MTRSIVSARSFLIVLVTLFLGSAGGGVWADFIVPIQVSEEDDDLEFANSGISIDASDNVSIIFEGNNEVYFASSLIGIGDDLVSVTDDTREVNSSRVSTGPLGRTYVAFAQKSAADGTVGSDVVLVDNNGGQFASFTTLAASPDDESEPAVDVNLGVINVVWTLVPDGSDPEIYLSHNEDDGILVDNGKSPQVATTTNGDGYVIYQRDGDVFCARYDAAAENFDGEETVSDFDGTESGLSIINDTSDTLHVIFMNGGAVYYCVNEGTGFSDPEEVIGGPVEGAALAAGPDGEVTVVYVDDDGAIQMSELDGDDGFGDPTAVTTTTDAEAPCADFDTLGYLHLSYTSNGHIWYTNNTPAPDADFTSDITEGELPLLVEFESTATGVIQNYFWEFGDGTTSNQENPSHTYEESGNRTVRLTVSGAGGSSTKTRLGYISVDPASNVMRLADIDVFVGHEVTHPIYATFDTPLQGYLVVLGYDENYTPVDEVNFGGSFTSVADPEFLIIQNVPDGENSKLTVSVIFDTEPPFEGTTAEPGSDRLMMSVDYTMPLGVEVGDEGQISFVEDDGNVSIFSADDPDLGAISLSPHLLNGSVSVTTLPTDTFLRGDTNLNGAVELLDVLETLAFLFTGGDNPECLDAADFNDNGEISLVDPLIELSFIFQGGDAPPYPYPTAGLDPTEDNLECDF